MRGLLAVRAAAPELYRLAFERPVPGFAPSDATMEESWRLLSGLEDEVIAAIASGEIRPGVPVNEVRDLIIAMLHGLASQHMANQPISPSARGATAA
ncbi:MAG: WHG domain-containing protein [Thermomicrobiales bacterium]